MSRLAESAAKQGDLLRASRMAWATRVVRGSAAFAAFAAFPALATAALILPQGQAHAVAVAGQGRQPVMGQMVAGLGPVAVRAGVPKALSSSNVGAASQKVTPQLLHQIVAASQLQGLDPYLVKAVVKTESAFAPQAVSPKGARGLMQVMPSTAIDVGLKPRANASVEQLLRDPWVSLLVGTRYLAQQLQEFGRLDLALAAYNAGPQAVRNAGLQVPAFAETQAYVRQVLRHYTQMRREGSLASVLQTNVVAMGGRS